MCLVVTVQPVVTRAFFSNVGRQKVWIIAAVDMVIICLGGQSRGGIWYPFLCVSHFHFVSTLQLKSSY